MFKEEKEIVESNIGFLKLNALVFMPSNKQQKNLDEIEAEIDALCAQPEIDVAAVSKLKSIKEEEIRICTKWRDIYTNMSLNKIVSFYPMTNSAVSILTDANLEGYDYVDITTENESGEKEGIIIRTDFNKFLTYIEETTGKINTI